MAVSVGVSGPVCYLDLLRQPSEGGCGWDTEPHFAAKPVCRGACLGGFVEATAVRLRLADCGKTGDEIAGEPRQIMLADKQRSSPLMSLGNQIGQLAAALS